ncbi:MAG: glycosyltransferase [Proteobacteria bacterium]|nr:glycosyltransferase [Pseudomonadota bacterium]
MRTERNEIWLMLDSSNVGGIESHVLELATALKVAGQPARVVFIADHGPHPLRRALRTREIPCVVLNGTARSIYRALRDTRPRLVHTHGYKAGILGRLLGRLLAVPVVSTFHAGEPGNGRMRLYDALDKLTAPLADCIAVSDAIAKWVPTRCEVHNNFVRLPAVSPGNGATQVAFVGRLSHEKGADSFCRIATLLPDLSFAIYGDGPMRRNLEQEFGERVKFHGMVDDMQSRWRQVGLLCMPSRHEGLPMAALEAMAHGVPIAAFAVGGLPRLVRNGEGGWLAEPGDVAALARYIRRWSGLQAPARATLSDRARDTVADRFSTKAVLPHLLRVYERAAASA